ncbi:hypothetical protein NPIL_697721 [Nephila pilipes]|uniref:Uncharacterized protein n=1 Tax=Nephila pilipes TaxID=299642 RepID=A0A8X6IX90_NEPPI|nr:hypothetical protein NPIL_697721 [Nephila pilipes]
MSSTGRNPGQSLQVKGSDVYRQGVSYFPKMLPKQKKGEEFFTGHAALTSQTGDADLPLTTAPSNAAPSVVRIASSLSIVCQSFPIPFLFRLSPEKIP